MSATDNVYGAAKNGGEGELKKVPHPWARMTRLFVVLLIIVVLVSVTISNVFVITEPDEYVIVQQFGEIVSVTYEPGLSYKLPFVQSTWSLPKDIQLYDLPISEVITRDKKNMVADSFVLWRISDPVVFIEWLGGNVTRSEEFIGSIVYNSMKTVISSLSQAEMISGRDQLAGSIFNNIGDSLNDYGITLIAVETKHLDLPNANKQAVYERMISERNNIAASYIAEGDSEATKIENETDKTISIQISTAEAEAERIIAEGEAEYMRILTEAYQNEDRADFYSFVRSLDAAKVSLKGSGKTLILSKDSPIARLFYDTY